MNSKRVSQYLLIAFVVSLIAIPLTAYLRNKPTTGRCTILWIPSRSG